MLGKSSEAARSVPGVLYEASKFAPIVSFYFSGKLRKKHPARKSCISADQITHQSVTNVSKRRAE
ncbi:hypothetical protein NQZ68_002645 [Dissostichus eleginoides]|nr:hypothetical protein NQZ68_002645 [Dissostichus eleginoides]